MKTKDYIAGLSDGRFAYKFGAGIDTPNVQYKAGYWQGVDDRQREPQRYSR